MIHVRDDIKVVCNELEDGNVILFPTDTVWSIGCDATSEKSIKKLFAIRNHDAPYPLEVLVDGFDMLGQYVKEVHPRIETLLTLHERPLTIVYPEIRNFPKILLGGNHPVGIRIVRDAFCRELITAIGRPLITLSANKQGNPFPRHFGEISSEIIKAVDYIVKSGQENRGESEPAVIATYDEDGQLEFLHS